MIVTIILITLIILTILAYNNGIRLKNYVAEAFSTMDVYLKKRWDLIPSIIDTVKSYTGYEKNILTEITSLRTNNYDNLSTEDKIETNKNLGNNISELFAVVENYPDLKSNETYLKLMDKLSEVENDIANSRRYYNGTVRELNNFLEIFPTNIIGKLFNIQKAKMFEIENEERENIKVN